MSTNHTPNYNLSQWEAADKVLRADFNADNAKIDAALGGLSAGKADQSVLNSVQSTVSSLSSTLSRKGNCNVETFSYVGNGETREEHPTVITFKRVPAAFLIFGQDVLIVGAGRSSPCFYVANMGNVSLGFNRGNWSGAKYNFWTDSSFSSQQANSSEKTYIVIAFYTA